MGKYGLAPRENWIEEWLSGWPYSESKSWTYHGAWVDMDKYDIVPKKAFKENLAKEKDKELEELERYYEKRKQKLLAEKKELTS
jgi:hypothetical protein